MSKINNRIFNYLLARQKRAARHEIFERAAEAELIEHQMLGKNQRDGVIWRLTEDHATLFTGDRDHDRNIIQKALEASERNISNRQYDEQVDEFEAPSNFGDVGKLLSDKPDKPKQSKPSKPSSIELTQTELAERYDHVLSIIASQAPSLKVSNVAAALLLAKAFDRDENTIDKLLSIIRYKNPIIGIRIPVHDFVKQFSQMMEGGLVMPYYTSLESIIHGRTLTGNFNTLADTKRRKSYSCLSGFLVREMEEDELRAVVSKDVLTAFKPLIIADEKDQPLPARLASVIDIMIEGDGIDVDLIADVLSICCQISVDRSQLLMKELGFEPKHLGTDDLAVAMRPGRGLINIINILMTLDEANASHEDDQSDGKSVGRFGNSASSRHSKNYTGCFDVIEPQQKAAVTKPNTGPKDKHSSTSNKSTKSKNHLFIEQLAGYGKAQDWAIELKQDLCMWQDGEVDWSDLSSRLLLSGPPGTGKTTYAKALCNTLQIPLITTSIARWLEPSHLGDVLSAITATFDYVNEHSPCILFIDEIDNIGSRNGGTNGSKNDDYWASLINRLLELLDGSSKTEGVIIVGATNRPEKIDAALLRSGRLEKHILIPPPNTEALIGIISYQLGADLDAVLESKMNAIISDTSPAIDSLFAHNTSTNGDRPPEDLTLLNGVQTGVLAHE
jgi:cell division protease FtsH